MECRKVLPDCPQPFMGKPTAETTACFQRDPCKPRCEKAPGSTGCGGGTCAPEGNLGEPVPCCGGACGTPLCNYDKETFECLWYFFNKEKHKDDEAYKTLRSRIENRPKNMPPFPIDCCFMGDPIVVRAAEAGMWKVVDYAIRCLNANPNKTGRRGMTALYLARRAPHNTFQRRKIDHMIECYGGLDKYMGCRDQFPCNYNNHYWQPCYPKKCGFDSNDYNY